MDKQKFFVADRDTETHRVCGTCGKLKPLSEFYRDGKTKDGKPKYRRDCKTCYKMTRIYNARRKEL
jgi:hypothetical protein